MVEKKTRWHCTLPKLLNMLTLAGEKFQDVFYSTLPLASDGGENAATKAMAFQALCSLTMKITEQWMSDSALSLWGNSLSAEPRKQQCQGEGIHQVRMGKTHLLSLLLSPPLSFYFAPALWEQGLFLPMCLHVAVKGSSLMDFLLQQTSMNNNCNNNAGQKWKMKAIEDCIREGSFPEDQPFSPVPQMVGLTCVSQGLCAVTKSWGTHRVNYTVGCGPVMA